MEICNDSNGTFYYFDKDGKMLTGWVTGANDAELFFGPDGAMHTGWVKSKDKYFYYDNQGVMQTGWIKDNGKKYYLNTNGEMLTGWLIDEDNKYFLNKNGEMSTGWVEVNENWYYFDKNGTMQTGDKRIGDRYYSFEDKDKSTLGTLRSGWYLNKDCYKMYLTPDKGKGYLTGVNTIDGDTYIFNTEGFMRTGFVDLPYGENGQERVTYYLEENGIDLGKMKIDCDFSVGNKKYHADSTGKVTEY